MRFALELLRDVLGLVGAIVSAFAFFRLEGRKAEAASVRPDTAGDADLAAEMQQARTTLVERRVLAPNRLDLHLTVLGLALIALSFLISIGLTLTAEHTAPPPANAAPAKDG